MVLQEPCQSLGFGSFGALTSLVPTIHQARVGGPGVRYPAQISPVMAGPGAFHAPFGAFACEARGPANHQACVGGPRSSLLGSNLTRHGRT
ncbi:MAG: hypothetical protein V3S07_09210 [Micropepsaceae bacterium]